MRSPAAALLVCALAGSACSSSDPASRAVEGPQSSTVSLVAPPTTVATTEPAPTTVVTEATISPSTEPTLPTTVAATIPTTTVTTTPPVEDLDDGTHVGIIVSTDNGTIAFDRVEPIDLEGDGNPDGYLNQNPRLRAVPLTDRVLLDGQVVDGATAASRLTGLTVLVRLTIVGQRLAAVDLLTVTI